MKILFSLTYYSPYVSGLTLYVKRIAEALNKEKYESTVICIQHERKLPLNDFYSGVRVVRARPLLKISKGFISFDWIFKSWQEVKKTDVIVINIPQFEGLIPATFGRMFGKKVISIYHCEVILPSGFFNQVVSGLLDLANTACLFFSQKIVLYTKDFAENSKVMRRFLKKAEYVYPPISLPTVNKRVQKMIIGKMGDKPDYVIGVAARLAAEKGIEYLFEAIPLIETMLKIQSAGRWTKFKIIVAGSMKPVGEENYRAKILSLVEKYKKYVVFLGEIKPDDMGSFYSLIDVLVLPSVNSTESFGMVQVEAMMMWVPVVASNLPGVRVPIQTTGMGRIVKIKDSGEIANAISLILSNKKDYIQPKKRMMDMFSMEKTLRLYEKIFSF